MRNTRLDQLFTLARLPWRSALIGLLLHLCLQIPHLAAQTATVTVPIKLDYELLRQLLEKQLFTEPGHSREIFNENSGCNKIILSNPQLRRSGKTLEIVATVRAPLGISFQGSCLNLLDWQGTVGFLGLPVIDSGATSVRIEPQDSWLATAEGARISSGRVWDHARGPLMALLGSFTIDLAPYRQSLQSLLPEVLPHRAAPQLQSTLASLRLGGLELTNRGLTLSLNFDVEELALAPIPEAVLSAEELAQWEERWQMMDTLLVQAVKHYAAATSLRELRTTLLDILIDSRYRLRDALATPDRSGDVVRSWFLTSWQQLSPVVRRIALEQKGQEPLMWFSVLAATDALYALDKLGPTIGLDISTDGLRRLARMLNLQTGTDELRYDEAIDPELQQLYQQQLLFDASEPSAFRIHFSLLPLAYAAPASNNLNSWVPDLGELQVYLPMMAKLLETTSTTALKRHKLDPQHSQLFKKMILATAWQESCWRQYVIKAKKIEPLRSSSGDIGLMQVNERVWRGFYDLEKLRWDINYNGNAGAEILLDYLVRYALRKGEQKQTGGLDNLARSSYSAYNGGPGQFSRYRKPDAPPSLKKVDAAFWEKFLQIKAGNEMAVMRCFE